MRTPQAIQFWGIAGYLRYSSIQNLRKPWGWKDPRNTFTLPIWLDLFPNAKIIHIHRHGVDVAQSLKTRQEKGIRAARKRFERLKAVYALIPKRSGLVHSIRCRNLEGGLVLWDEYMKHAETLTKQLGKGAAVVAFEKFVADPVGIVRRLVRFCSINVSEDRIYKATMEIKRDRALAYRREPLLKAFAEREAIRLRAHRY
jgi:hypothetical protein